MNATDKSLHAQFLNETAQVDPATTQPFAKSRKIYVEGSRPDIRVPFREISLSDTPSAFGAEQIRQSSFTIPPAPTPIPASTSTSVTACPRYAPSGSRNATIPRNCRARPRPSASSA